MKAPRPPRRALALDAVSTLALAVWFGGLVVLGAVVAPIVFRTVPMPTAADAMTLVFRRFDSVALGAAIVACLAEGAALAWGYARVRSHTVMLFAAAALALVQAMALSAPIEALHREGAVRGRGAPGERLEVLHRWAERSAKTQVLLLAGCLFLGRVNTKKRLPV
ncbi:MAG: DUF4149 domain-containing protein [Myxococcales bacterium]|nr:DUF4149 domain-containing protein [Myxococcales bacterium]